MKIAVPTRDGLVDAHFGHCEQFVVYSFAEDKSISREEPVASPAGCGCKSGIAGVLAGMGVTHLVAGNMGEGAVQVLNAGGIDVVRGASGSARRAAELFARGELTDSRISCAAHARAGGPGHECGDTPATP